MKKSLFLLLITAALTSCAQELSADLEKDQSQFKLQDTFTSHEEVTEFQTELVCYKGDDQYYYHTISIDHFSKDYHHARFLISPDKEVFYPFGYESTYTMVSDPSDANKEEGKYPGVYLNFKSTVEVKSLFGFFASDEISLYFTFD